MSLKINLGHLSEILKKGSNDYVNPVREWLAGLSVAITIFVCGIIYTAYDFYKQLIVPPAPVELQQVTYREEDIRRLAEEYEKKEEAFNEMRMIKAPEPVSEAEPLETIDQLAEKNGGE
jgi:hypothetical protein